MTIVRQTQMLATVDKGRKSNEATHCFSSLCVDGRNSEFYQQYFHPDGEQILSLRRFVSIDWACNVQAAVVSRIHNDAIWAYNIIHARLPLTSPGLAHRFYANVLEFAGQDIGSLILCLRVGAERIRRMSVLEIIELREAFVGTSYWGKEFWQQLKRMAQGE